MEGSGSPEHARATRDPRRWTRSFFPGLRPRRVVRCDEIPDPAAGTAEEMASAAASAAAAAAAAAEAEPVHFEKFNREWQQAAEQDNFDGFRIEAAKQVTKWLQAAHTLFLGTQLRECGYIYQFGPAFQSEDQRTVLVARAGLDGAVSGRAIQKFGQGTELKCSSNSHLKDMQRNMHEGSVEYTGAECTLAAKLAWQGAWLLGGAFTQRVVPSLHLGGDLVLVAVNGVTSIGQVGMRWAEGKDVFTATVSRTPDPKSPSGSNLHECRLHYVRKVTDRVTLGSELKVSHPDMESGMALAYEYGFRTSRVQGLLDTDGKVSCCLSDFQAGFGFSGMIDYARGDYKFGFMMHVQPQPEEGPGQ